MSKVTQPVSGRAEPWVPALEPRLLAPTLYHLELIVLTYHFLSTHFSSSQSFPSLFLIGLFFFLSLCSVVAGGWVWMWGWCGRRGARDRNAVGTGSVWRELTLEVDQISLPGGSQGVSWGSRVGSNDSEVSFHLWFDRLALAGPLPLRFREAEWSNPFLLSLPPVRITSS